MPSLLGSEVVALSSGTQNVTVPSGTQGVIAMGRAAGGDLTLTSSFAGTWTDVASGGTTRLKYAPVTSTGAQTLTPSWGWGPSEGPVFVLFYVGGVDASSPATWIRDADDAETSSITVDSQAGDLVLAFDNAYAPTAAIPGLPSGWTSLATTAFGDLSGRARSLDTVGGPTTTVTTSPVAGTNFHGLCVVSVFGSASSDASGGLPPVQLAAPEAGASGGGVASAALASVSLSAPEGSASAGFEWPEQVAVGWIRVRPGSGLEVWHSAPGRSILEHYYFGVEAGDATNATGALPSVSLTAPDAAATGGGAAAGSFDAVDLSAPQADASGGAAASGDFDSVDLTAPQASASSGAAASGSLDAVDIEAPQASATGGGVASGAVSGVSLTAPQGASSSGATASGALSAITLAAPQGAATGGAAAAGAVDAVDLSAPQASATGGAAASGLFDSVDLIAPQASAASAGPGAAVGALSSVSLTPAQAAATGAASVAGALPAVTLTAPQASAGSGAVASGSLASVSVTPPQAGASGGAVAAGPMVGINLTPAEAEAIGAAWVTAELAQIALTAPQGTATEGFVPEYTDLPSGSGHTRKMASAARPAVTSTAARAGHTATQRPAR